MIEYDFLAEGVGATLHQQHPRQVLQAARPGAAVAPDHPELVHGAQAGGLGHSLLG